MKTILFNSTNTSKPRKRKCRSIVIPPTQFIANHQQRRYWCSMASSWPASKHWRLKKKVKIKTMPQPILLLPLTVVQSNNSEEDCFVGLNHGSELTQCTFGEPKRVLPIFCQVSAKHVLGIGLVAKLSAADTTQSSRTRLERYFEPWFKTLFLVEFLHPKI